MSRGTFSFLAESQSSHFLYSFKTRIVCTKGMAFCVLRSVVRVGAAFLKRRAGGAFRRPWITVFASAIILTLAAENSRSATPSSVEPIETSRHGAKIRFAEPVFDFGEVDFAEVIKHSFVFANTGDETLRISDVRPSCGCTMPGKWDRTIEPGKSGKIPVQLTLSDFGGPVLKTVTIVCNDVAQSNVVLQIKGKVSRPIDVVPARAIFSLSSEDRTDETRVLRVLNNTDEDITLSPPECSSPAFRTEIKTVRPGKEFQLHVTLSCPPGNTNIFAPINLRTSSSRMPIVSIPAHATVQPAVTISPTQVILPPGVADFGVQIPLTIRNIGTNTLVVSKSDTSIEGVEIETTEVKPGHLFRVLFEFPPRCSDPRRTEGGSAYQNQPPAVLTLSGAHRSRPDPCLIGARAKRCQVNSTNQRC